MRIPRFYFPDPLTLGARVNLPPEAAHHAVRVLRLGEGDTVTLFNGDGHVYRASILHADTQEVLVRIEQSTEINRESSLAVTLLQGISSGERKEKRLRHW